MEFGAPLFHEFAEAYSHQSGPRLSLTLSPEIPTEKLRKIWKSQNAHDIKGALKRGLRANAAAFGVSTEEVQGWVEVYTAYWKATGEILAAREARRENGQVSRAVNPKTLSVLINPAVVMDKCLPRLEATVERFDPRLSELWV